MWFWNALGEVWAELTSPRFIDLYGWAIGLTLAALPILFVIAKLHDAFEAWRKKRVARKGSGRV